MKISLLHLKSMKNINGLRVSRNKMEYSCRHSQRKGIVFIYLELLGISVKV